MSLQVWLPLTKDLRQQGLSNATVSIMRGNETWDNSGKLGKCFYANGVNTLQINNIIPQLYNIDGYSLCAWFCIESQNTVHSGAGIISGGNWNNQVLNLSVSDWSSDHYTKLRVSGTNWNNTYTYNFYKNIWYHAVVCSDGNKTYAYINGQLIGNTVAGFLPSSIEGNNIAVGGATYYSGMQFFGKINDVRIYDHCLSPMEVKQISQGLILHYPLNRNGWGQENLLPISGSTIINSTQSFEFQGWVQNFYTKTWMNEHLTPGKQYTLSYTVTCLSIPDSNYTFKENRASPILVHQGSGWSQVTTTSDGIKDTNMSVGQSRDYKCTFTFATASETYEYYGLCGYTALYRDASNNQQYARFRIDNLKLEEGSIVTPWCPNSSDALATTLGLNGTTEYDCSGFGNNGTRTGTFEWTSDTPKYQVSTYFAKGVKITSQTGMVTDSNPTFTCNFWLNAPTGTYTQYNDIITFNGNAQFRMETSNTTGTSFSWFNYPIGTSNGIGTNGAVSNNTWNMFTITCDGSIWKTYKNGVLASSREITGTAWTPNGTVSLGDAGMLMRMSDLRIYATALSATDVLSLYQNSAYIDSSGNVYGTIHEI